MKCKETNKLFTAYLDGEVTENERKDIQAHLASCPACRKEAEALSATQTKFRQTLKMVTETAEPPVQAWAKLREQILSEKEATTARVLPPRETWWERMGRVSLIPRRLTLRTATAGLLAVILIATAAVALPMLTGNDERVSAAEIALKNPDVEAALGGSTPSKVGVNNNIDSAGMSRVVMTMPPDRVVVADVNMKKQTVTHVNVQSLADITQQQVIDIAKADPRVRELLNSGLTLYYNGAVEIDLTTFQDIDFSESMQLLGINDLQDLIGFMAVVSLKWHEYDYKMHLVLVNVSTGKVVAVTQFPPEGMPVITTTKTIAGSTITR